MLIRQARRVLLYVFGVFFLLFGLAGLFAPGRLTGGIHLLPEGVAGLGEMRGLYGGGFAAFGIIILAGLYKRDAGLLRAMAIIAVGITVGRLVSLVLDQDVSFALPNACYEALLAVCCYFESRQVQP